MRILYLHTLCKNENNESFQTWNTTGVPFSLHKHNDANANKYNYLSSKSVVGHISWVPKGRRECATSDSFELSFCIFSRNYHSRCDCTTVHKKNTSIYIFRHSSCRLSSHESHEFYFHASNSSRDRIRPLPFSQCWFFPASFHQKFIIGQTSWNLYFFFIMYQP